MTRLFFVLLTFFMLAVPPLARAEATSSVMGQMQTHTVESGETLIDIALKYNVGFVELRAANPDAVPLQLNAGDQIVIPTRKIVPFKKDNGLLINLPEMRIYYFPGNNTAPTPYAIGIGREGLLSPLGELNISRKQENPVWHPTDRMLREDPSLKAEVGPGPDNPLGSYAMYLSNTLFRIHGTNKPWGVGRRSSSGCIRMYPDDIKALYPKIPVGTSVTIIDQPIKFAWQDGDLYLEADPSQSQADQIEMDYPYDIQIPDNIMKTVIAKAGDQTDRLDWQAIRAALVHRPAYPVKITI